MELGALVLEAVDTLQARFDTALLERDTRTVKPDQIASVNLWG